jgi:hypothetical protein
MVIVTEARGNRQGYGLDSLISSATWCLVADNDTAELERLEKDVSLFREQLLARIRTSCEVADRFDQPLQRFLLREPKLACEEFDQETAS